MHLAGMKKLGWLTVGPVPQLDSQTLSDLPQVVGLTIEDASLTPATLAHLEELKGLKSLRLHGVRITDAHLAELTALPRLTELYFDEHELTQAGLDRLATGTNPVYGSGGRLDGAIRRLSERLPQTKILVRRHERKRLDRCGSSSAG
jgi:hypothetical protein